MSSKFVHQSFPNNQRTAYYFADDSPAIYTAPFTGSVWLDTSLLPPESIWLLQIIDAHMSMLTPFLARRSKTLDDVCASQTPGVKQLALTLRVECHFTDDFAQIYAKVYYARIPQRIDLSTVSSRRHVSYATAEAEINTWRMEHGYIAA